MAQLPSPFISHARRVCNLYKRAVRNLESIYTRTEEFRYEAVLLRDEFDKNRNVVDPREAKELLIEGEKKLDSQLHLAPIKFFNSPGGAAFERSHTIPDWVLDYWDPMEKASYPKYFAKRELRKKEYEAMYRKQYPDFEKYKEDPHPEEKKY